LILVDAFQGAPIATHSQVEDDVEWFVERPLHRVIRRLPVSLVYHVIQSELDDLWRPLHLVVVPIADVRVSGTTNLRADGVVAATRVHRAVDLARVVAHVLHDIDFAALWPAAVLVVSRHHPERRPSSSRLAAGQPGADGHFTVQEVGLGLQLRGGIALAAILLAQGLDLQSAIAHERIHLAIRVKLLFVVAEATALVNVVPLRSVYSTLTIEIIAEDLSIALSSDPGRIIVGTAGTALRHEVSGHGCLRLRIALATRRLHIFDAFTTGVARLVPKLS